MLNFILYFSGIPTTLHGHQLKAGTATLSAAKEILDSGLEDIKKAGTWKSERVITSKQGSAILVQGQSNTLLNFCANNYLGLSVSIVFYLFFVLFF